ncbi:MAG: TspO/MBR family protein [Pseudomonadota bacterium]
MDWSIFALYFAACAAAATTGAMFQPGAWYQTLDKPNWTPPNWLFPVAWTCLYILMSFAGMRVALADGNAFPVTVWALQIALNTLWTPIFFGLRRLQAGMIVILFLWLSVAGFVVAAYPVDPIASLLFAPYLLWVSVAAALNFSVMRRNPDVKPIG